MLPKRIPDSPLDVNPDKTWGIDVPSKGIKTRKLSAAKKKSQNVTVSEGYLKLNFFSRRV